MGLLISEFCREDKLGNGICDSENNLEKCGYDHGDCIMENLGQYQLENGAYSKPFHFDIDEEDFEVIACLWNETTDTK